MFASLARSPLHLVRVNTAGGRVNLKSRGGTGVVASIEVRILVRLSQATMALGLTAPAPTIRNRNVANHLLLSPFLRLLSAGIEVLVDRKTSFISSKASGAVGLEED